MDVDLDAWVGGGVRAWEKDGGGSSGAAAGDGDLVYFQGGFVSGGFFFA